MESSNFGHEDKLEFQQIVLLQIKKILEISSHELRDMTYVISHSHHEETRYQEDTRQSYIQAIQNLAYILMPYFDKKMLGIYDECEKVITAYPFVIQKMFSKEIKSITEAIGKETINLAPYCIDKKIEYAKKLFIALNMLLKRNDYLKSAVYGEGYNDDEIVEEET